MDVVRASLVKYGLSQSNLENYCLIRRTRTAYDLANGLAGTEYILPPTDHPLDHLIGSLASVVNHHDGLVITFEVSYLFIIFIYNE